MSGTDQILENLGTAGYRVQGKFKKLGTAGYRVPGKFQKLGTAGYRVPNKFFGYRWVPGTGQKKILGTEYWENFHSSPTPGFEIIFFSQFDKY